MHFTVLQFKVIFIFFCCTGLFLSFFFWRCYWTIVFLTIYILQSRFFFFFFIISGIYRSFLILPSQNKLSVCFMLPPTSASIKCITIKRCQLEGEEKGRGWGAYFKQAYYNFRKEKYYRGVFVHYYHFVVDHMKWQNCSCRKTGGKMV